MTIVDSLAVPFVYPSAWFMKNIRRVGVQKLPLCKKALLNIGVFPIRNHYYEPQFVYPSILRKKTRSLSKERGLPGISWNIQEQLETLEKLEFSDELENIPTKKADNFQFYLNNGAFEAGDAEYWYNLIRLKKPRRIFEVGSGYSTLMAINAIRRNQKEDPAYLCKHVCIEPYEMSWLEKSGVSVVRKKVEDVGVAFFLELKENDILFIDSSHIIRPEGDVLFEYLELLPALNNGVVVHVHDIFSPRNYLIQWLVDEVKFWNEQYLMEAFLTNNNSWKIIGSLNYLHHHHYERLKSVCTFLTPDREPGSFYIQKIT